MLMKRFRGQWLFVWSSKPKLTIWRSVECMVRFLAIFALGGMYLQWTPHGSYKKGLEGQPRVLDQCFSTAGLRPGTGPWPQIYRAARGLRKLQYATRFH